MAPSIRAHLPDSVADGVSRRLGVDARALAALRVALGLLVLADLAVRAPDLVALYTDAGVLPRSLLVELYPTVGRLSPYALSGSPVWAGGLFALTALAAVALAAGYRSRLAAFVVFLLVASLHARNPLVLTAGDSLLRRLLLWGTLLPLGARWGLDARREAASDDWVVSVGTAGLLVQAVAVYLVNAVIKLRGPAWRSGEAVRLVYGMDALTVGLGEFAAELGPLLTAGTHAWVVLLVASPLLVAATGRARTALVAAFAGGHLFMLLTLWLGVFPLISVASLLAFLPPAVWDRIERRVAPVVARTRRFAARLPRPGRRGLSRSQVRGVSRAVAVLLLAFVVVWNAAGVGLVDAPATGGVDPAERRWDMFAPHPMSTDGWYVPVGTTTDGRRVDALGGGDPTFRVDDPTHTYPSQRWYRYLTKLRTAERPREEFIAYLCGRWNRTHAGRLARVEVVLVTQPVQLDAPDPTRRRTLVTRGC